MFDYKKIIRLAAGVMCISGMLVTLQNCSAPEEQPQKYKVKQQRVTKEKKPDIITDCNYDFEQATAGLEIPAEIKKQLVLVNVQYYSFDGKLHAGQLVINKKDSSSIVAVFKELKEIRFPVKCVIPVVKYHWNDEESMEANNTSAFNYRRIEGSYRLSNHAKGFAIDINPRLNPQYKHGEYSPHGAVYDTTINGTIHAKSGIVKIFKRRGWKWGGEWVDLKDYQHFEKK